jgi:hypothetical protein
MFKTATQRKRREELAKSLSKTTLSAAHGIFCITEVAGMQQIAEGCKTNCHKIKLLKSMVHCLWL